MGWQKPDTLAPDTINLLSVSDMPLLDISYTWNHMFLKFYPCYNSCQYLISFYGWIMLHCVDMLHSIYPVDGHLGCFYLAMINNAAENIHFGVDVGFHFSYMYTLGELPGHKLTYIKCCMIYINIYKGYIKKLYLRYIKYINSMFNIFRNCCFSKWLHYFTFPSAVY